MNIPLSIFEHYTHIGIRITNSEQNKVIQEYLFKLGCQWWWHTISPTKFFEPAVYTQEDLKKLYENFYLLVSRTGIIGWSTNPQTYFRDITFEELLQEIDESKKKITKICEYTAILKNGKVTLTCVTGKKYVISVSVLKALDDVKKHNNDNISDICINGVSINNLFFEKLINFINTNK